MLIPLGTDAPVYHWPVATSLLVIACVAASIFGWTADPERVRPFVVLYGEGLQPLAWLTAPFFQADIVQLIGNLIYLWGFGLVIEGKVGWFLFLAIFLGLAAGEGAIEQSLMLGVEPGVGGSMGCAAVLFGLIAMGLVWAPHNEIQLVLIVFWRFMLNAVEFELAIAHFALIYFLWEGVLGALWSGLSGDLHLVRGLIRVGVGGGLGFLLATIWLKLGLVDCEGWDLFSRGWSGRAHQGGTARKARTRKRRGSRGAAAPRDVESRSVELLGGLRAAIQDGAALDALGCYQDLLRMPEGWRPLEPDLVKLIGLLQRNGFQAESRPVIEDYLARFGDGPSAAAIRLKLAQMLVREERPAKALRLLAEVPEAALPENLRAIRRKLIAHAQKLRDEGVLELEGP